MKLLLRLLRILPSGVFLYLGTVCFGHVDDRFTPLNDESLRLASVLLDKHPYLLPEDQRDWLDEQLSVNQQQREGAIPEVRFNELLSSIGDATTIDLAGIDREQTVRIPAFQLPGDRGGILFKIQNGEGPIGYSVMSLNMAEKEKTITVPVSNSGTTWVLLSMDHVPDGITRWYVSFDPGGLVSRVVPIQVEAPIMGRLKVDILSDDTSRSTSAIVQLKWMLDGSARPPGSAVDYTPQFDSQSTTRERIKGSRLLNLPGIESGHYWVCTGPFDMSLPPGDWQITILRGHEHIPVTDTFSIRSGSTVEKRYRPKRWVNMADRGWYSGDDHVHMRIQSDSDADRLLVWAQAEDIHVVNVLEMGDHERTFFQQRGWGEEGRTQSGNTVLVPGQEDPRIAHLGHTIALNISEPIRDTSQYYLHDWVYDQVHKAGGLYGYAHVNRGLFDIERDLSLNAPKGKIDFVELLQFHHMGTDLYYRFLNLGEKLTASAGSDVPWGRAVGEVRVYAYLGMAPFSADGWFDALEKGRTFVTNGPMLEFSIDETLPGDQIDLESVNGTLRVKARVWGHPDRLNPIRLEIVRSGEVIRSVNSEPANSKELILDFEYTPSAGSWLAARAYADNGSVAHTTPIYLKRPELRFWKHEAVPDLIQQNLSALKELEILASNIANPEAIEAKQGVGALVGAWYARPDLVRAKSVDFYDRSEMVWGNNRPKQSPWSARWQGLLTIPEGQAVPEALYLDSSGASSLAIDGHVLIDSLVGGESEAEAKLQPGKPYSIILSYQHLNTPLAYLHLTMRLADGPKKPIPQEWFYFTSEDYKAAYLNGLGSLEEQRTLSSQSRPLLDRINETREIYRQWLIQWVAEKVLR